MPCAIADADATIPAAAMIMWQQYIGASRRELARRAAAANCSNIVHLPSILFAHRNRRPND
jgi:hypothetical protein